MNTFYYVVGDRVYCKGKGEKEKALALKKVIGCLRDTDRAHFRFSRGWWVLVRGGKGWLCVFSHKKNVPYDLGLQLLAMLDRLEKEVDEKWRLL